MLKGNTIKHLLLKTIILLYLFSSFVNSTHLHVDEEEHFNDCQICTIITLFNAIPPVNDLIDVNCKLCSYLLVTAVSSHPVKLTLLKGFFSHAPPFLSFI